MYSVNESSDSVADFSSVRNCSFFDSVVISEEIGEAVYADCITLPCGLSDTVFRNCFLFPGIAVYKNTLIENSVILRGSIIMGCGRVTCERTPLSSSSHVDDALYGNGVVINMGNETGGLQIRSFADLRYGDLSDVVAKGQYGQHGVSDYLCVDSTVNND